MSSVGFDHKRQRSGSRATMAAVAATATALVGVLPAARGATKYFDTLAGAGNGVGGSGLLAPIATAQAAALYSNSSLGDATLSAAAATDDGVFQGTAGTVTVGGNYALNSATFSVTGYTLTTNASSPSSSSTAYNFSSPITLGSNVTLNIHAANATANRTIGLGSITGGIGSSLVLQGQQTGTNTSRINLSVAGATVSVPITITYTGSATTTQGYAGIVSTATNAVLNSTVTNNTVLTTNIGATQGFQLTVNGVISGTAGTLYGAGSGGGAGLVILNAANTYAGPSTLNNSTNGVVQVGIDNALPDTPVLFGLLTNNTGALDLNGHVQTVASIATAGTGTVTGIVNTSATTANLVINGTGSATYGSVIGKVGNVTGANDNIALTLAATNTVTQALTGVSTYTGFTNVSGGTLALSSSTSANNIAGSAKLFVGGGAKLDVSAVTTTGGFAVANKQVLAGSGNVVGNVTIASGSTITGGTGATTSDTVGTLSNTTVAGNVPTQTWAAGGTYVAKVASTDGATVSGSDQLVMSNLTLSGTGTFAVTIADAAGTTNSVGLTPVAMGATAVVNTNYILIATDNAQVSGASPFNATPQQLMTAFTLATPGLAAAPSGYGYQLDSLHETGSTYDLIVDLGPVATPEPTSLILTGLAAAPLAVGRRRRRHG